jgi:hypothetical protein
MQEMQNNLLHFLLGGSSESKQKLFLPLGLRVWSKRRLNLQENKGEPKTA